MKLCRKFKKEIRNLMILLTEHCQVPNVEVTKISDIRIHPTIQKTGSLARTITDRCYHPK
jgi:hypothetical protein